MDFDANRSRRLGTQSIGFVFMLNAYEEQWAGLQLGSSSSDHGKMFVRWNIRARRVSMLGVSNHDTLLATLKKCGSAKYSGNL